MSDFSSSVTLEAEVSQSSLRAARAEIEDEIGAVSVEATPSSQLVTDGGGSNVSRVLEDNLGLDETRNDLLRDILDAAEMDARNGGGSSMLGSIGNSAIAIGGGAVGLAVLLGSQLADVNWADVVGDAIPDLDPGDAVDPVAVAAADLIDDAVSVEASDVVDTTLEATDIVADTLPAGLADLVAEDLPASAADVVADSLPIDIGALLASSFPLTVGALLADAFPLKPGDIFSEGEGSSGEGQPGPIDRGVGAVQDNPGVALGLGALGLGAGAYALGEIGTGPFPLAALLGVTALAGTAAGDTGGGGGGGGLPTPTQTPDTSTPGVGSGTAGTALPDGPQFAGSASLGAGGGAGGVGLPSSGSNRNDTRRDGSIEFSGGIDVTVDVNQDFERDIERQMRRNGVPDVIIDAVLDELERGVR